MGSYPLKWAAPDSQYQSHIIAHISQEHCFRGKVSAGRWELKQRNRVIILTLLKLTEKETDQPRQYHASLRDRREVWCPDTPIQDKATIWLIVLNRKRTTPRQNVIRLNGHLPFPFSHPGVLPALCRRKCGHPETDRCEILPVRLFIWKQDLPILRVILCLPGIFRNPFSALWMTDSNSCYFPVKLFIPLMTVQQRPPPNRNLTIQIYPSPRFLCDVSLVVLNSVSFYWPTFF